MNKELSKLQHIDPNQRAFSILAQVAKDRQCVYRWLSLSFYPPDELLANALRSGQMMDELQESTIWLGKDQNRICDALAGLARFENVDLASLNAEYEHLFGKSIERLSPREATYRWRDVFQIAGGGSSLSQSLRQYYEQSGVKPEDGMEDHLAVEFEFLAYLCEREAYHWLAQSPKTGRELRRQERTFLDDHLGHWFPEFCWRLVERAPVTFYGQIAKFCDVWLSIDFGPGYFSRAQMG